MATITFSQGEFFHPYYGWFDKEPDLPNYAHRSGLVTEKIGLEHMMTPDHPLYEVSQKITQSILENPTQELTRYEPGPRTIMCTDLATGTTTEYTEPAYVYEPSFTSKWAQSLAQDYDPVTGLLKPEAHEAMIRSLEEYSASTDVYEQKDLSYYLDGSTKFAGSYAFVYEGNTMTAKVDFQPKGSDPINVVAHYEEHRANIESLRNQGFHDDTISMLIDALNEAFINTQSRNFEQRLQYFSPSMSSEQAKNAVKSFFEEYLRVRGGASSMESAMTTAGNILKRQGLFDARFDVTTSEVTQSQREIDAANELNAAWTASPEYEKNMAEMAAFTPLNANAIKDTTTWDPADTHIRSINSYVDYSKNTTMSDIEKEARSLSIVFRVRGDQMIDYARRYEELMGQLDSKLSNGEISAEHYDRYRADLDTAFIKTHNLNIKGQAEATGLSEEKATELAEAFSKEYIKLRGQANPDEIDAEKIANAALKTLASQGWPEFSLYSSENRATVSADDPWYAMVSEDALYWQSKPQAYQYW